MAGANNPGKNNRMNVNMPRPSWMWIYGVIGILILGYYVFGDSNDTPVRSRSEERRVGKECAI